MDDISAFLAMEEKGLTPFEALVLGFFAAGMSYLGENILKDEENHNKKDLTLAKHNGEVLNLLREKTQGNLSKKESELLDEMIRCLWEKIQSTTV